MSNQINPLKADILYLGFKPYAVGDDGRKEQKNPLSYGGPREDFSFNLSTF